MAPGVKDGKRSATALMARNFQGQSATQQVHNLLGPPSSVRVATPCTAWVDPRIDYSKPWFEEREGGYYCHLCHAWATDGHVLSKKHKDREEHPDWYFGAAGGGGPSALSSGVPAAPDPTYDKPWFENRGREWYCLLCNSWATEGHVNSDKHRRRESCPAAYGFGSGFGSGAMVPVYPGGGGATPSYTGAPVVDEAYGRLLQEYASKPWFEQREGEWYCNLCHAWATEGHIAGDKHTKRAMYPSWYGFDYEEPGSVLRPEPPTRSQASSSMQRAESPLPPGWTSHWESNHQRSYYHNAESNETTWEKPRGLLAPEPPPPPLWSEHWDAKHKRHYYHNRTTGETTWERPDDMHQVPRPVSGGAAAARTPAPAPAAVHPKADWQQVWDDSQYYYFNTATGESQWEVPPELQATEEC